ncbi:MAG: hypothetical protein M1376_04055 [Planctomycetes bacterium]|nr:hypothetical protein [Planctomycetota bacterium]
MNPGFHESVNCPAAAVGAGLVGVDKRRQDGYDYVRMCERYFSPKEKGGVDIFANAARLFYTTGLPPENQTCYDQRDFSRDVIAYEGLRRAGLRPRDAGKVPCACGEPLQTKCVLCVNHASSASEDDDFADFSFRRATARP